MRICREKMDNPDLQDLPDKKATEATTGWKDCQVQKVNKVCSDQSDQQGLPAHTVPEVSFDFCSLWQKNKTKDTSIPFDWEQLNVGEAMNLTSGKFTAPRDGIIN